MNNNERVEEKVKGENCNESENSTETNMGVGNCPGPGTDGDSSDNPGTSPAADIKSVPVKPERYPGFDFTKEYSIGQKVYFVRLNRITSTKSYHELVLRTVGNKFMVGVEKDAQTQVLGPDVAGYIFKNSKDAVQCYDLIKFADEETAGSNTQTEEKTDEKE